MNNQSQTMIRISKRENPYVTLDKTGLNDSRLSWKAKGLLCYLLSLPDNWKIYVNELKNHSSDGRDSTATALRELIQYGYIIQEVNRDEKGLFKGYIYNIFEVPSETIENTGLEPETENPYPDKPYSENPKTEKPKLINNNNTNKLLNNKLSFDENSIEYVLAAELKNYILRNNPNAKVPDNLRKWANDINKMIRLDKRSEEDLRLVIEYSQSNRFWQCNILSPAKLREKFDTLYLQGKNDKQSNVKTKSDNDFYRKVD